MRSRLRLFAAFGVVATVLDVAILTALAGPIGTVPADLVALVVAALFAYHANRRITFRGMPRARWVRHPATFSFVAFIAGSADLAVVAIASGLGAVPLLAKALALVPAAVVRWIAYRFVLFTEVRREMQQRHDRPPVEGDRRVTVVVPAYEEGSTIASTVERLHRELRGPLGDVEVLVADDGSGDDTADRAEAAGARVLRLTPNRGKGAAVRDGVLAAAGRTVVFTDADLAYGPAHVVELVERVEAGWDVVVGSRRHQETTTLVRARRLREVGGRAVNWLTHLVLLGHFRDTQCGLKAFRRDIAAAIFERTTIDGFAFDVEIFLIAEQDRYSLLEVPVEVENRQGSSVRIVRDTARLLRDLWIVRRRAGRGGYRPTATQAHLAH